MTGVVLPVGLWDLIAPLLTVAGKHEPWSGSRRAIIRALNGMEAVADSHFRWILASEPAAVY
jgi:hypothetical protein